MKLKGIEEEQLRLGFVLCRKDSMCRPCRWFDATVQVQLIVMIFVRQV